MELRQLAKNHRDEGCVGKTTNVILNRGFFTNIDRTYDRASKELATAIDLLIASSLQSTAQQVVLLVILRFLQSPRNGKDGVGGAHGIATVLLNSEGFLSGHENLQAHLRRDSPRVRRGSYTYHAVLSKMQLADLIDYVGSLCDHLSSSKFATLSQVVEMFVSVVDRPLPQAQRKQLEFHPLQIALDLFWFGLVDISDNGQSCPLTTASKDGLMYLRHYEQDSSYTLASAAEWAKISPICCQSALCEYSKYMSWAAKGEITRLYKPRV